MSVLRSVFISLSGNRSVRGWAERSRLGRQLASRFVAGTTIEDAIAACRRVNAQGMAVSLDSLGESVTQVAEARAAADVYYKLLNEIARQGLNANVSLKLSQMGIAISPDLAEEIVAGVVERAAGLGLFVRIDMEGSGYTQATLAITERLHSYWPTSVGTVLQAYLFRTEEDAGQLLKHRIRIRLCKGAYQEGPEVAFPSKRDVDANYATLMKRLVTSGVFCGIATHDEELVGELLRFIEREQVPKTTFEFQMLYGVRRDLQRRLAAQGFGVRVYIPFGTAWYPYFMRRLAERPANLLFLMRNLIRS